MNAPAPREMHEALSAEVIARARAGAASGSVKFLEALEEESGLEPSRFTEALARLAGALPMDMDGLHAIKPAFEVLPYADAVSRDCILFRRDDGGLIMVVSDPFDLDLRAWCEERIDGAVTWKIAHRADIGACLKRHEETMRAMDGMVSQAEPSENVAPSTTCARARARVLGRAFSIRS